MPITAITLVSPLRDDRLLTYFLDLQKSKEGPEFAVVLNFPGGTGNHGLPAQPGDEAGHSEDDTSLTQPYPPGNILQGTANLTIAVHNDPL